LLVSRVGCGTAAGVRVASRLATPALNAATWAMVTGGRGVTSAAAAADVRVGIGTGYNRAAGAGAAVGLAE
jgi:hypothetical protein